MLGETVAALRPPAPLVAALPRGGVPVGFEVASALGCELDVLVVRKVGVPFQPELAMGAVVDGSTPLVVRNEDVIRLTGIDEAQFEAVRDRELAEIEQPRGRSTTASSRRKPAGRQRRGWKVRITFPFSNET